MSVDLLDRLWHQKLGRPYHLAQPIDVGRGQPIILLHGIGRTGQTWQRVVEGLASAGCRVVAFDLLGFGASPKPNWPQYDIDDHARAVIAGVERLRAQQPVILVGHSMGCLVAVRVARLRPDLVKHLVLYQMPLIEGLPEKRRYRLQLSFYNRLSNRVTSYQPTFDPKTARLAERLAYRIAGFQVDRATWQPFVKSLEHTIMRQTTADDIKAVAIPMDVIYGTYDMFVIRGKPQQIFGAAADKVTAHTIHERHVISKRASRFLVERIKAAL
jgi:cis-3-alkyl-4-acyloxetan-2-one decarboxylase